MSNYDKAFTELESALIEAELITEGQLAIAKESQKNLGGTLEQILIDKGFVSEEKLLRTLAKKINTTFVSLAKYKVDINVVRLLPVSLARKHRAIPIFKIENKITVATSNPMNLTGLDDIRSALECDIEAVLALDDDIERAIREHYRGDILSDDGSEQDVEVIANDEKTINDATSVELLEKAASGKQTVSAVNNIILQAESDRASDVHFEPTRNNVRVRIRIDGVLEELAVIPKSMHLPIISRIKIMGGMDIAERRIPQDGRVRIRVSNKELDMRIATYPTMFGEASAVRLLSKDQLITLEDLGLSAGDLSVFQKIISKPHGIFLVTGPTGSGKTTTLYAALQKMNSADKHIISVEDPVEHEIAGIDQQQVNVKAGLTFAASIRSMLRQDPDVIMVGEIRDAETADIAIRSAMTGHFVLSTLHTNTAIGAIVRLVDLGVETFLISSSLVGVMAQRLVRRICPKCKEEIKVADDLKKQLGKQVENLKTFKGAGCKNCRKTGYLGRIGLFEMISINDEIKALINAKASEAKIHEAVMSMGNHSILEDGIEKINQGITTIEEVVGAIEVE